MIWILKRLNVQSKLPNWNALCVIGRVVRKLALMFLWSYALVGFVLLEYDKWFAVSIS